MTKRLNKKVALIGSIVFLLLVAVAVVAVLRQGGDPEEFLKNADASWQRHDYKSAEYNYMKAYQLLESDPLRVETLFKLAQLYIETDQWPKVRGCWERIINIEPGNVTARLGRLEYLYIVAENYARLGSSVSSLWSDIQSQASELIKVAEDTGILNEDKAKWETSLGASEKQPELSRSIGAYLYLVRARASLESAKVGAVTAPEQLLTTAMDDLKKVQELEPNNVNYYWFLVQTTVAKGEILASRGNLQARETAVSEAAEFLEQAVKAAPSDPRTHINLLSWRFERARRAEPEQTAQQLKALEPLYLSLVQNFPLSAEAFAELSRFYSVYSIYSGYKLSPENLDKAIGAIDKAIELDKQNVSYAISSANLHYRRFSIYGQRNEVLKAMAIATDAITFPSAKETAGPRSYAVRMNRFMLYSFLAHCYIEQILEPSQQGVESQKQDLLTKAEDVVHQIEQIFGSGDEPQVVKWQGMLELARGNTSAAVGKLYEAYEQIKASRTSEYADAELAYTLAGIFRRSSEIGAVMEFLVTALGSGIEFTRPAAILDYLESLNELGMSTHVLSAANLYNIDRFEERFGTNARSRAIRVHALIDTGRISEAEQELARLDQDDPATIRLNLDVVNSKMEQIHASTIQRQVRQDSGSFTELSPAEQPQVVSPQASEELLKAEFINHSKRRLELVQKLLTKSPGSVEEVMVAAVCRDSISQGWITQAESLIDRYLEHFPDSTVALSYKKVLSEPDPKNIPQQRRLEIEKQVLLQIKDPARQAVGLGLFYQKNNQIDEAVEQFKKVLEMPAKADTGIEVFILSNRDDPRALAADCLFEIAAQKKDWQLAEDVVQTVRQGNLDDCQGQLFAARLSAAKGEFDQALTRINECLKSRPIFSLGFLLRAHIEDGLENERASLADIRKAFSLNPLDGTIAKALANALYQRNLKLGDRISSDQESEVRQALQRAVGLNPGDLQLLSAYAEYISSTEPSKALGKK